MIFSAVIWVMIPNHIAVDEEGLNAQFFPKIVVVTIFILSTILSISSFFNKDETILILEVTNELKIIAFALSMVAYIYLLNKIGFIISSIIFTTTSLLFLHGKKRYLIVMSIFIIIIYISFRFILDIRLP